MIIQSANDEAFLLKKLSGGDEDAIICLFDTYYKPLVFYAQNILGDKSTAEEIVQTLFAKLWEDRKEMHISISVKAYLLKAVKNRCLDFLKHEKVKNHFLSEFEKKMIRFSNEDEEWLFTEELSALIKESIENLPDQCREIFKLSRFEEKKYKEIAVKMGISIKTVEVQISKALKKLREQLGKYK